MPISAEHLLYNQNQSLKGKLIMNIEIAEKIKKVLVDTLRIPEDELEFDSELFGEDIGLDSIDSIEIIACIDELFGIDMTGAPREDFQTIETLANYVETHKEA